MRLIDADKYPCKDCGSMDDWCKHTCGMLKEWLNTTAYDVDKVVDELEDSKICPNVAIGILNLEDFVYINQVIDIVKRGGIE